MDHPRGGSDDLSNVAAGVLTLVGVGANRGTDYSNLTSLGNRDLEQESPWRLDVIGGSADGRGPVHHETTQLDGNAIANRIRSLGS